MTRLLLIAGPLAAIALAMALGGMGWSMAASATAGITLLCALWWIFEPIPIPFTSHFPPNPRSITAYGVESLPLLVSGAHLLHSDGPTQNCELSYLTSQLLLGRAE